MPKIDPKKLDLIAELEVEAILEGLNDPEVKLNPSFLKSVRLFLSQNNLRTDPKTPGVQKVVQDVSNIPDFEDLEQ